MTATVAQQPPNGPGPDRIVLLGTRGGPNITGYSPSPPANLLVYKGVPYVVDAGYGVTFKLVDAGLRLPLLRYIFITHNLPIIISNLARCYTMLGRPDCERQSTFIRQRAFTPCSPLTGSRIVSI
ncbi:hypothetical protein ACVIYL_004525 [Bradyrhizobium sp. USDA 3315]